MSGEARPITAPALQLYSSSRLRSSDQIRTIIYNFAGDTGHQQEAASTIMEQTARARAGALYLVDTSSGENGSK